MRHGQFSVNSRKIKKTWENTNKSISEDKNQKNHIVKFESINFTKQNIKIPLISDKLYDPNTDFFYITIFDNFPEDFINYFKPMLVMNTSDAYNTDNVLTNTQLTEKASDGTLKVGDIVVGSRFDYWYNKVDEINLQLRIRYDMSMREVTSYTPFGGFSTASIPVTFNIYMQGINPKIYEQINQQSQ